LFLKLIIAGDDLDCPWPGVTEVTHRRQLLRLGIMDCANPNGCASNTHEREKVRVQLVSRLRVECAMRDGSYLGNGRLIVAVGWMDCAPVASGGQAGAFANTQRGACLLSCACMDVV